MVKTTPPGRGSRLLRHGGPDPVHDLGADAPCGARLLATGPFDEDDLGVACYHSKTGAVELYLNHLVDGPGEYVVVDCTAGADSFASGLFTRFDLTVLVAEPTRKGISVYRQWQGTPPATIPPSPWPGTRCRAPRMWPFLREHADGGLLAWFGYERAVRAMEQGRPLSLDDLSPETAAALGLSGTGSTRSQGTGPGTHARQPNSTGRTPGPGPNAPWARTSQARSTRNSPSGRTHSPWQGRDHHGPVRQGHLEHKAVRPASAPARRRCGCPR